MASENDTKKMFASPIVAFIFGKDTINAEENLPVESKKGLGCFCCSRRRRIAVIKEQE